MNGRVLGIAVRRSPALLVALAMLPVLALVNQAGRGMAIVVGDQRGLVTGIIVPLTAAVGAWLGRRDQRSGTIDLLTTTPRPAWMACLYSALALACGVVAGWAVVLAATSAYGLAVGAWFPPDYLVVAAASLGWTLAAAWLGLAVGRAVPWPVTPPLLAVVMLVGLTMVTLLIDTEAGPPPYPGSYLLAPSLGWSTATLTSTIAVQAGQSVWVVVVAAAMFLLATAGKRSWLAVPVLLAAGVVGGSSLLPTHLDDGFRADQGALALECTRDEPVVCARRFHPYVLDGLTGPGREFLTALRAKLPDAPTRVEESYLEWFGPPAFGPEPDPDVVSVEPLLDSEGRISEDRTTLRWLLALGAGSPDCVGDQPPDLDGAATARILTAAWALGEPPYEPASEDETLGWVPPASVTHPEYETFVALPEDVQVASRADRRRELVPHRIRAVRPASRPA